MAVKLIFCMFLLALVKHVCSGLEIADGLLSWASPLLEALKRIDGKKPWEAASDDPNACVVGMGTEAGANCWASVECQGDKREYRDWNVCYVNGRQFFTDDRIGDFSITFTSPGGPDQGLTLPILQLKEINDFEKIDVEAEGGSAEDLNGIDPKGEKTLCRMITSRDQKLAWMCAVPKSGKKFAGIDSTIAVNPDIGYAQGQCGVHLTQYQIPVGPDNFYSIDAVIKDANGDTIGNIDRTTATGRIDISSKLPYTLAVTTVLPGSVPNTDAEPVQFGYGADLWNSGDKNRCSQGAYDSGARRMDCGFAC